MLAVPTPGRERNLPLGQRRSIQESAQRRGMRCSELARLDLEAVQPIAPLQRFHEVAPDRQPARLPLAQHVKVFVQNEIRVAPERRCGVAQQNAVAPRRRASAEMQSRIERVLDNAHVIDRLAENFVQSCAQRLRRNVRADELHACSKLPA
jgi:hypothetical protein